ncbi:MAG TPA: HEPN domain-containing protein [Phycisphaerae bacterium]|nr:HEPN domain-containing protein [Phycisphaerae bacterium]
MQPELVEVKRWIEKADHDRRMAEAGLDQTPPITDGAAFHCQQAAEKLLKLIWFTAVNPLRRYMTWAHLPMPVRGMSLSFRP